MIKTLLSPFKRFAWFKRANAKITYEWLAKHVPARDWSFMNYGYVATSDEAPLSLATPPPQRYPLYMYHYLAAKVPLKGRHVVEVGSGRGGGARHVTEYYQPASYVGIDLAHQAVKLARELHPLPSLTFQQGSAESLPLADASADVILNVESCHAYGSVPKFLREVKRVLKPGGYLLMVDFRYATDFDELKAQLAQSGLTMREEEDITHRVIAAIEAEDETKRARIKALLPSRWQDLFCEFAGVVGSKFHRNLKSRERVYYRWVMQRP